MNSVHVRQVEADPLLCSSRLPSPFSSTLSYSSLAPVMPNSHLNPLSLASSYSRAILSSTPSPIISCPYPLYLCFPPSPLHLLPFSLLPNHQVYRAKFVVHIERLTKEKSSGATIPIGIHPSSLQITSIHLDGDRKALLARKDRKAGDSKKMETEETSA
jgi:hypothetical protein